MIIDMIENCFLTLEKPKDFLLEGVILSQCKMAKNAKLTQNLKILEQENDLKLIYRYSW